MKPKMCCQLITAALLVLAASAAIARDNVTWSVGADVAPGVSVGATNARPVVVQPAPVYVAPRPVYVAPQPVYVAPPPRVVVVQRPVYREVERPHPGKHKGWDKKHHHHGHDHHGHGHGHGHDD